MATRRSSAFGTNDLTQMSFGFSRDDAGKFLIPYIEQKILPTDPFDTIDQAGVGKLMQMAVEVGKGPCAPTSSWASAASMAANRRASSSATRSA